jgi:hypothetical protein
MMVSWQAYYEAYIIVLLEDPRISLEQWVTTILGDKKL